MKLKKITAIYSMLIGIVDVLTWAILIVTNNVPDLKTNVLNFSFHWTSEFLMAGLLIIAGYLILSDNILSPRVYYFATGILIIAIIGADIFYIINFNLILLILGIIITISAAILAIKNYEEKRDFYYFTMGTIIYAALNVIGNTLQKGDFASFAYQLISFIFAMILVLLSFKSELKFE
ncbi:MAG: hypothetical protein ACFFCD_17410 [Promethearchaeota archaeon]